MMNEMTVGKPDAAITRYGDATASLPVLVRKAAEALAGAETAAEVLEAHEMAGFAYDAAKRAVRLAKAKAAHDEVIAAVARAQADALAIEAAAKRRLADEYDAAQARGELRKSGQRGKAVPDGNSFSAPTTAEIGLTRKQIHEARMIRDIESADPGVIERTAHAMVASGKAPTRSGVAREIAARKTPAPAAPAAARAGSADVAPIRSTLKRHGPVIEVPGGMTLEAHCRAAAAAEGMVAGEIANRLGLKSGAYRQARLIIALADIDDLPQEPATQARAALALMNETRQVGAAYAMVETLVDRVFGEGAVRKNAPPEDLLGAEREEFEITLACMGVTSEYIPMIEIPHLSPARAVELAAKIREHARWVRSLAARIEAIHR